MKMEFLSPNEAAGTLKIGADTLANWRCQKIGPRYVKIGGRVFYRPTDISDWIERHTVETESVSA